MRIWGAGGALCCALLLVPFATAGTAVSGALGVEGSLFLPPRARTAASDGVVFSGLMDDGEALSEFRADAPRLKVTEYESTYVTTALTHYRTDLVIRTWEVTAALLTLADGTHAGHVGIDESTGAWTFTAAEGASLRHPRLSTLQSAGPRPNPSPADHHHYAQVVQDHVHVAAPGDLVFQGRLNVKITGPDIVLTSNENRTPVVFSTGESTPSDVTRVYRWLYLSFDGTLEMSSPDAPIELAFSEGTASWEGPARFRPVSGTLRGGGATFSADGRPATLDGAFSAELVPTSGAPGRFDLTRVSGTLASTTLPQTQSAGAVALDGDAGVAWFAGFAVGAVLLAGGGWGLARRSMRRRGAGRASRSLRPAWASAAPVADSPAQRAAAYAARAEEAAEEGWYDQAVDLLVRAQREDPRDASLCMAEATYRLRLGEWEAALVAYERAGALTRDGEAYKWAALACLDRGHVDYAVYYACLALHRDARLACEISREHAYAALREHDDVRAALRRALTGA